MHRRTDRGFTFIEVIVVIVIISIIITTAALTIGHTVRNNKVDYFARQLYEELRFAQQQAIIRSVILGFSIADNEYQFYYFSTSQDEKEKARWIPYAKNKLLSAQAIPAFLHVNFESGQQAQVVKDGAPMAIISTDGQMTPFRLTLGTIDNPARFGIIVAASGDIQFLDESAK